ncbi:MAG TPA: MBL fold metallo-hydrolase [Bryobacteraceae bacterium]|nr:MBL fold metallo-hydrolase [Bryobacteraceae bacterium]
MRTSIIVFALCSASFAQHPVASFKTAKGELKLTAIHHASFVLEGGGQVLHCDPWSQGDYTGVPQADLILITDTHGDHLDLKALALVRKASSIIIASPEAAAKIEGARAMKNGESMQVGPWKIEAVPMYNIKRGPAEGQVFHPKGRGNGYIITYAGFRFYNAGDTEGTPEMRALKGIDVVLIPMNLPYTMTPEEAADAVKAFKPKVAIPFHYRGADLKVFEKALAGTGVEARILDWYK